MGHNLARWRIECYDLRKYDGADMKLLLNRKLKKKISNGSTIKIKTVTIKHLIRKIRRL